MSLLPQKKEKKTAILENLGLHRCSAGCVFFPATCRQLVMRVKRVMLTFATNLQRLTTCGSLIHKTHPLIVERPALQNTAQLS